MMDDAAIARMTGATAFDSSGDKIGKIGAIFLDDDSGQPSFATVSTGLFGMSESFVPLQGAGVTDDGVQVTYTKDQVKDAPRIDAGGHLSPEEEDRLFEHYGLAGRSSRVDHTGHADTDADIDIDTDTQSDRVGGDEAAVADRGREDRGRGDRAEATETVTAHEERLNVDTRTEETGRVRLRKYVTTETENVEVPVSKEKLVVEREDAGGVVRKGGLDEVSSGEHEDEIVLREERPVVEKETVEREKLRVGKETITDTETVSEEVRTEHVDVEGDGDADADEQTRR